MRSHEQEYGREEADGLTECCEHGIPAMCPCKKCDESERESRLSPARGYAAMRVEAEAEAQKWEPFTQNHDPSYWKALRDAYASGYVIGASAEQRRHNIRS